MFCCAARKISRFANISRIQEYIRKFRCLSCECSRFIVRWFIFFFRQILPSRSPEMIAQKWQVLLFSFALLWIERFAELNWIFTAHKIKINSHSLSTVILDRAYFLFCSWIICPYQVYIERWEPRSASKEKKNLHIKFEFKIHSLPICRDELALAYNFSISHSHRRLIADSRVRVARCQFSLQVLSE